MFTTYREIKVSGGDDFGGRLIRFFDLTGLSHRVHNIPQDRGKQRRRFLMSVDSILHPLGFASSCSFTTSREIEVSGGGDFGGRLIDSISIAPMFRPLPFFEQKNIRNKSFAFVQFKDEGDLFNQMHLFESIDHLVGSDRM